MADLKSLIAELEKAKEGSRELSDKVLLACGWTTSDSTDPRNQFWRSPEGLSYDWWDDPHARSRSGPPLKRPSPTESLDDGLAVVVLEGYKWSVTNWDNAMNKRPTAWVHKLMSLPKFIAEAPTPTLALCIASLRARDEA